MRRPSYRFIKARKIIQMIKRNCFQSDSQVDRSFKTKKYYAQMIKRGNGFEVSLTSTVETDLRLSTLCCPVAVYKGRRFQFVLVAKKSQ